MTTENPTPEFSFQIKLDAISDEPREFTLEAKPEEKTALACRFGVVSIDSLEAQLTATWLKPGRIMSISGRISAGVTQACVVTLEFVPATVNEVIEVVFARNSVDTAGIVNPDEVEPLDGETLDLGELVAEELSLALDPYPRHPDIDLAAIELGPGASLVTEEEASKAPKRANPFEILAELKPKP